MAAVNDRPGQYLLPLEPDDPDLPYEVALFVWACTVDRALDYARDKDLAHSLAAHLTQTLGVRHVVIG